MRARQWMIDGISHFLNRLSALFPEMLATAGGVGERFMSPEALSTRPGSRLAARAVDPFSEPVIPGRVRDPYVIFSSFNSISKGAGSTGRALLIKN
jgi:hypothetical protein